jgi:hypothetical protein
VEIEAQQVARFIGGLRLPIQDKVSMQHVFTLTEAVSLATRAEKHLERSRVSTWEWNPGDSGRVTQNWGKQPMVSTETTAQPSAPGGKTTRGSSSGQRQPVTITTPNNPYARPGPEKCFRCNQPGHKSNQCPKRQMISLIEAEGEAGDGAGDGEDDEAGDDMLGYEATEAFVDEGVLLSRSLVIRRVLLVPGQESQAQKHNIFRTCCTVNQREHCF